MLPTHPHSAPSPAPSLTPSPRCPSSPVSGIQRPVPGIHVQRPVSSVQYPMSGYPVSSIQYIQYPVSSIQYPPVLCPVSGVPPGLSGVERDLVGFCKTLTLYTHLKSQIGTYMTNLSQAQGSSTETNTDTYLEMWVTDCGLLIVGY